MLRHLVFLSVKDEEAALTIQNAMNELVRQEGIKEGVVSFYFEPYSQVGEEYNCYFFIDFKDEESRKKYLEHPKHLDTATGTIIPRLRASVETSVLVFDYMKKDREEGKVVNYKQTAIPHSGYILVKNKEEAQEKCKLLLEQFTLEKAKILENCTIENLSQGFTAAVKVKNSKSFDGMGWQFPCFKAGHQRQRSQPGIIFPATSSRSFLSSSH